MKLSHSALEKYLTCPFMYFLHYIEKLRPDKIGSPLIFGDGIDQALNILLLTKKKNPTHEEFKMLAQNPFEVFNQALLFREIKGVRESIPSSLLVQYNKPDFDSEILTDDDKFMINSFIKTAGYLDDKGNVPDYLSLYNEISEQIQEGKEIASVDQTYYNYCSWWSLRRKGWMFIEHYRDVILPQIKEVISIQRSFCLPNDQAADQIIGKIDAELIFEDEPGVIYTLDNKTSSGKYKVADINEKGQLPIYSEETGHKRAGYIVLLKHIKKKVTKQCDICGAETENGRTNCQEKKCKGKIHTIRTACYVESQTDIRGEIDENKKAELFDKYSSVMDKINDKQFEQNRDNCWQFGQKCPYYDYCRSPGNKRDITGLYKVGTKKPCEL